MAVRTRVRSMLARLASRFPMEEINGHATCPTYLYRWQLWRHGDYALYLHHFVGDDWSKDLHDHPKRFISLGLKGDYVEWTRFGNHWYRAPWLRTFPARHAHRITVRPGHDAWTLVLVLRREREWGFWPTLYGTRQFVHWRTYVGDRELREQGKACP